MEIEKGFGFGVGESSWVCMFGGGNGKLLVVLIISRLGSMFCVTKYVLNNRNLCQRKNLNFNQKSFEMCLRQIQMIVEERRTVRI